MVPFAGYRMPSVYGDVSQVASHQNVRQSAGLFDVGHMLPRRHGDRLPGMVDSLLTSTLEPYASTLSVLLNEQGGIIDDMMITKHASTEDLAWFAAWLSEWNTSERSKGGPVEHEVLDDWNCLPYKTGPAAADHLQALTYYDLAFVPLNGIDVHVARGGYSGEDGFEISVHPAHPTFLASALLHSPVQLAGLSARDSLRLNFEAGMCFTTPVEAVLSWVIGKDRCTAGDFNGAPRRRVGLIVEEAPARCVVTSGIPLAPTSGFHKKGTPLAVEVRKKAC
ncbi:hypothetical protein V8E53_015563 [Lactarius tabidus]